jgi:hypothetical protein
MSDKADYRDASRIEHMYGIDKADIRGIASTCRHATKLV